MSTLKGCVTGLIVTSIVLALIFVGLVALHSCANSPLDFDSAVWKQNRDSPVRERMLDDAVKAIQIGMTKAEVEALLGTHYPKDDDSKHWWYRAFHDTSILSGGHTGLYVDFDDDDRVIYVSQSWSGS